MLHDSAGTAALFASLYYMSFPKVFVSHDAWNGRIKSSALLSMTQRSTAGLRPFASCKCNMIHLPDTSDGM